MEQRPLGRTGLQVSAICLGTMTWGQQNDEAEAFAQMDLAIERGVTFFDTAEMYPVPPTPETQGRTETYIGNWLESRGARDRIVLASKVTGRSPDMPFVRGGSRLDRKTIETALDESLKKLKTDYLDLYQLHWPDRVTNFFGMRGFEFDSDDDAIPLEETFGALADLAASGKIRHVGLSNDTPWGAMQALRLADANGLPRAVSIQNPYNLLNRIFEVGLAEIAIREDVGLLAYSPLAGGVLTGKYLDGNQPDGARMTLFGERYTRYFTPNAEPATRAYVEIARRHGLHPAQMAIAYCLSRSFMTSVIIGATSTAQLETDIAGAEIALAPEVLEAIEEVQRRYPDPCP